VSRILFAVAPEKLNCMAKSIFKRLPAEARRRIESSIAAVTDGDHPTAVRPFMFGGKITHELYFDLVKLRFLAKHEKIGAIISAFIIASLAGGSGKGAGERVPLSDQALFDYADLIVRGAREWKSGSEVSAFLRRLKTMEDEWRRAAFS
jgi:hypothetical protein